MGSRFKPINCVHSGAQHLGAGVGGRLHNEHDLYNDPRYIFTMITASIVVVALVVNLRSSISDGVYSAYDIHNKYNHYIVTYPVTNSKSYPELTST